MKKIGTKREKTRAYIKRGRNYTINEKIEVVTILHKNCYNYSATAKACGINETSLKIWANQPWAKDIINKLKQKDITYNNPDALIDKVIDKYEQNEFKFVERVKEVKLNILNRIDSQIDETKSVKDLSYSLKILHDIVFGTSLKDDEDVQKKNFFQQINQLTIINENG
jgi:transposase-like protein